MPSSTIWQAPTIDLGSSTAPLGSLSSLASAAAGVAKAHAVARSATMPISLFCKLRGTGRSEAPAATIRSTIRGPRCAYRNGASPGFLYHRLPRCTRQAPRCAKTLLPNWLSDGGAPTFPPLARRCPRGSRRTGGAVTPGGVHFRYLWSGTVRPMGAVAGMAGLERAALGACAGPSGSLALTEGCLRTPLATAASWLRHDLGEGTGASGACT